MRPNDRPLAENFPPDNFPFDMIPFDKMPDQAQDRVPFLAGVPDIDIVIAKFGGPELLPNEGGAQGGEIGTFETAFGLGAVPNRNFSVSLGDIDGDGDLDILATNDQEPNQLLVNQGGDQGGEEGSFALGVDLPGGSLESRGIALGDVDGDGDLDALISNSGNPSQPNQLLINQGGQQGGTEGEFVLGPDLPGNGTDNSWNIALGDVDGDGDLDAVVSNLFEPNRLLINQGGQQGGTEGDFVLGPDLPGGIKQSREIALGDIDGDGDLDALVANSDVGFNTNQVLINQGGLQEGTEGTFLLGPDLPGDSSFRSDGIALGDLDGDGDLDAVLANSLVSGGGTAPNQQLINQGGAQGGTEGSFALGDELPGGNLFSRDVALGDVDADGDLDVIVVNGNQTDQLLINQGGLQGGEEGTFSLGQVLPRDGAGSSTNIALGDIDGDGTARAVDDFGLPNINQDGLLPSMYVDVGDVIA